MQNFSFAQAINIGTPIVKSYSPADFKAGTQSWDLSIGDQGTLFVANNDGLLIFDGEKWHTKTLPNKSINRSVLHDQGQHRIYVGGQDELGYFQRNGNELNYVSIRDQLNESLKDLEDVWDIKLVKRKIFFRSKNRIISFDVKSKETEVYQNESITFLSQIDSTIYFNNLAEGLFKIDSEGMKYIPESYIFKYKVVTDIVKTPNNDLLIFTVKHGIYLYKDGKFSEWENNAQEFLINNNLSTVCQLNEETIAIGTQRGGLCLLDYKGRCLQHIDKNKGLQSNNITSITGDNWGNIWLGNYAGIDHLDINANLQYFSPDGNLQGAVYDIALWKNQFWFGTSNGLYTLPYKDYYNPFEKNQFTLIARSEGQVWGLDVIDDQLFLGHNQGAFVVNEQGTIEKIRDSYGAWKFVKLSASRIALGTYTGVFILKKEDGKWLIDYKVADLEESARIMIMDKFENLWVSHPYRGLYQIKSKNEFVQSIATKFESTANIGGDLGNYVFNIYGTAYVSNDRGVFKFDSNEQTFVLDTVLNDNLKDAGIVRRLQATDQYIWYIADQESGQIDWATEGLSTTIDIKSHPSLSDLYVGGFEKALLLDKQNRLICSNNGVLHHYTSQEGTINPFNAMIADIKLTRNDSSIYKPDLADKNAIELKSEDNALTFDFRTNGKISDALMGYSHRLKGLETEWTEYDKKSFKEYTNLDQGDYTFMLRAKDKKGHQSEIFSVAFTILPPWYLSALAKLLYSLIFLSAILALIFIPRKKYKETTAELVNKQKATEQIIEKIKEEQLQQEINYKNQELANSTLHLLQKNQTINNLRVEIERVRKNIEDTKTRKELKNIISLLRSDIRLEEDWGKFSAHFDQVHDDFSKKLKMQFPQLTSNDRKLCAYLKMNLSTKEIAPLLNISIRGVEISRYRLRKKLDLEKGINLNEFMNKI